jgi:hypothetical protein
MTREEDINRRLSKFAQLVTSQAGYLGLDIHIIVSCDEFTAALSNMPLSTIKDHIIGLATELLALDEMEPINGDEDDNEPPTGTTMQ